MRSKRGALELSVNTIIVVVIGITLLALGLVFVQDIFNYLSGTAQQAFQKADITLGKLEAGDTKVSTPTVIDLKQGESRIFDIIIANDGTAVSSSFKIRLDPHYSTGCNPATLCANAQNLPINLITPGTATITPSDQPRRFQAHVIADSNAPPTVGLNQPSVSVIVEAGGQEYYRSAILIKVVKGGGLFG